MTRLRLIAAALALPCALLPPLRSLAQTQPTVGTASSTQPTAADYALDVALRDAINANYKLTFKQLDQTYAPDDSVDDLQSRRDAAADALAKLLPPSFGRQGVLDLFTPGPINVPLPRWQQIRTLFSQPGHWLCNARTVVAFPMASIHGNGSNVVEVFLGEIKSRAQKQMRVGTHDYSVNVIRLNEGATGKATSYIIKTPPSMEVLPPSTVVVHVDRFDRLVQQYQTDIANLPSVDFPTRESNVRSYFSANYRNSVTGIASVLSLRNMQLLSSQALGDALETEQLFESLAYYDGMSDPDLLYALTHSGTSAVQRALVLSDRTAIQEMGYTDQPLIGLFVLLRNCSVLLANTTATGSPASQLTASIVSQVSQKLAELPAVSAAIATAPPPAGKKLEVNFEALLQSWQATPEEMNKIARSLVDDEYARSLITLLVSGARGGVTMDAPRIEHLIATAQKLAPDSEPLQLQIGALYFYRHADSQAEKTFTAIDEKSTNPEIQSSGLEWLAYIKLRANDRDSALDCLQLAVQLSPTAPHLYLYASELDKAGKNAKAIESYQRFLTIEAPSTPLAANAKKRIAALQQPPAPTSQPIEPGL